MSPRFCRYQLRTNDVEAARRFYAAVLGRDDLEIIAMPAPARAAGAPPHWLGSIGVDDAAATTAALVARGGQVRGPALRAPEGAMIGLAPPGESSAPVVWHELHAPDAEAAFATYAEVFGWRLLDKLPLPFPYRTFTWDDQAVGGVASFGGVPGRHVHWLFYFAVADLDVALAAARAGGARSIFGPEAMPDGSRVAQLDDDQGGAFALRDLRG
jgi:predicted enzyme related to lactoylglutathione lyase